MRELEDHHRYIDRALELAAKATGSTFPNPLVGAVIVRDGNVIGEGYHRRAGSAHAEVEALSEAGTSSEGATLYLNLEPCCHCGRTGPCTDAIMEAGISRVVFSIHDPDPRVRGKGASILRNAGVEVVTGIRAAEAVELNMPFIHHAMTGKTLIVLKLALTLDGRLTAPGRRRLTGEETARRVHILRGRHEAIAVGSGTLKIDDPLLDRRLLGGGVRPPIRMVFDTRLETVPPDPWDTAADRVIWFCSEEASSEKRSKLEALGVEVVSLPAGGGGIDLEEWKRAVAEMGVSSVLVEGGGRIASSIVASGLADRIILFHAPLLGGSGGVQWYGEKDAPEWLEAEGLATASVERLGADVMTVYDRAVLAGYARDLATVGEPGGM